MSTKSKGALNKRIQYSSVISIVILVLLLLFLSVLNRDFLSFTTLTNVMFQVPAIGVVALGAMVVIISGGIDFSAGYGISMIGMAAGLVISKTDNFYLFSITFIIAGAILGLANGLVITKLKILPFIATFAMMSLAQGMSLFINGGNMVLLTDPLVRYFAHGKILEIPVAFILYIMICLITMHLMKNTKFGTYTFAIGSNEEATKNTGIKVDRIKILIYIFAGICTGLASFLTVTKIGMVTPSITGSILIDGIAATCIGGTSMAGGKGNVVGTVVGTIIIILITTALTYLNIPPEFQDVFKGSVILLAVLIDSLANRTAFKD